MKTYELVIEQRQPTCGGNSPKKVEIRTVTTDDPVAYVRSIESAAELEVTASDDGVITVRTEHNGNEVKYEFTED